MRAASKICLVHGVLLASGDGAKPNEGDLLYVERVRRAKEIILDRSFSHTIQVGLGLK